MADKQCQKCGETASETKAFCPGCGTPFVEEEVRTHRSEFDAMDSTVQLGQTMYNQMLSDMGLNVSRQPNEPEGKVEVLAPAAEVQQKKPTPPPVPQPPAQNTTKWIIVAAAAAILLLLVAVIAAALVFIYWTSQR